MKNSLLKISFIFWITLISLFSVYGQEAIKIDETSYLRCDMPEMAILDELFIKLNENPDYAGLIIVYGPQKGAAIRYARQTKFPFIFRKLKNLERVSAIYGGFKERPFMELWAIPKEAKAPSINAVGIDNKSAQFDSYDYIDHWKGESCDDPRIPALKVFAQELKQNPTMKGYIVGFGYNKKNPLIDLNHLKNWLRKDKRFLKKIGLSSSRIKTIIDNSDDENYLHAELWIAPKGAEPPKPTSAIEKASKSVKY